MGDRESDTHTASLAPASGIPRAGRSRLVRPLVIGLGAIVVLFAAYEVIERTLLGGVDPGVIYVLHLIRGLGGAAVAATIVAWLLIGDSPPLPATVAGRAWSEPVLPDRREIVTRYAEWFVRMRWVAVVVAAILALIATRATGLLAPAMLGPLLATIGVLAAANLVYPCLARDDRLWHAVLPLQVYVDLTLLTVMLHFSGGIENPLSELMFLHVIIGGVILTRRSCYSIAVAGGVLYALLVWSEWAGWIPHHRLHLHPHADGVVDPLSGNTLYVGSGSVLHAMILLLAAFFVSTIAERIRHGEHQVRLMADHAIAEHRLLDQALETTGTAVRVVDRDLRAALVNTRWKQWLGGADTHRPGRFDQIDGPECPARKTLRDGTTRVTRIELPDVSGLAPGLAAPFGERRVIQLTTASLGGDTDAVEQVVELAQDITDQQRRQEQMIRADRLAAVGELAGHVAHEVNNPTAIINAKARLLLSDHRADLSDKTAGELAKIVDLSDRVARIAQGLLSYCRPSPATRTTLDIRAPIRKALSLVEQRARTLGVAIDQRLDGTVPPVRANVGEMEQVFLNLLLNAMDAMESGDTLRVATSVDSTPLGDGSPALLVRVSDTGRGIDPNVLARIFDPFFTTKRDGKGTGLGLSICQGIIKSHGGSIDVDSLPGRGTSVTIRLPGMEMSHPREDSTNA